MKLTYTALLFLTYMSSSYVASATEFTWCTPRSVWEEAIREDRASTVTNVELPSPPCPEAKHASPQAEKPKRLAIKYSEMISMFDAGHAPNDQNLQGKWNNIGVSTTKNCASLANNNYESDGLRNEDGSIFQLAFVENEGLAVRAINSSKDDSEPSPVTKDSGTFYRAFSLKSSEQDSGKLKYGCRLLSAGKSEHMICGFRLILPASSSAPKAFEKCANDENGVLQLYVREKF